MFTPRRESYYRPASSSSKNVVMAGIEKTSSGPTCPAAAMADAEGQPAHRSGAMSSSICTAATAVTMKKESNHSDIHGT
jgi:hypothetical protein